MAKSFSLSLAYVLGMAISYAIAGMIAALIGNRIQTDLQNPGSLSCLAEYSYFGIIIIWSL